MEGIKAETNSRRVSFNGSLNMQSLRQLYSFRGLLFNRQIRRNPSEAHIMTNKGSGKFVFACCRSVPCFTINHVSGKTKKNSRTTSFRDIDLGKRSRLWRPRNNRNSFSVCLHLCCHRTHTFLANLVLANAFQVNSPRRNNKLRRPSLRSENDDKCSSHLPVVTLPPLRPSPLLAHTICILSHEFAADLMIII